ncbi:MAG: 50S ribosomal protein L9 [Spirochaetae bacterium HGW-Spirochaetae-1]|jgi:large subunit ribosomal protein L9|nr:MAG: 50S ribosomal protein L9 [Spirochaetae bacterium HGW-Spirochaetae-1]
MKVILQKDVPNLGDAGDIKDVADGYARNYLLPQKLVILANSSSQKAAEHQKRLIKFKKEKRKKVSEKLSESMSGIEIKLTAQVGDEDKLFGSITTMDIAKQLKMLGFEIDKRKIQMEQPIKELGEFEIPVKLEEGLTAKIKVIVEKAV